MKKVRQIYDQKWKQRKLEDPVNYKNLQEDYVGDVSVRALACGDPRVMKVYLARRQPGDREKLFRPASRLRFIGEPLDGPPKMSRKFIR